MPESCSDKCCGMSVRSVDVGGDEVLRFDLTRIKESDAPQLSVDLSGDQPQCPGFVDGGFCQATTMAEKPVPYKFAAALRAVTEDEEGWHVLPAVDIVTIPDGGCMWNGSRAVRFHLEGNRVQALCSHVPDVSA